MSAFDSVSEQYESSLFEQVLVTHLKEKALEIVTNPVAHEEFYAQLDFANNSSEVLGYVQINSNDWDNRSSISALVDSFLDDSIPITKGMYSLGYSHEVISSRFRHSVGRMLVKLIKFQKLAVAGMHGDLSAEYLGQTLAFDARIATPETYFHFDNMNNGVPVSPGIALLMPKYIGLGRTMSLVRKAQKIDSEEALSLGLITEIVNSEEEIVSRSVSIVKEGSEKHPHVIQYLKEHIFPSVSEVNKSLEDYYDALAKSVIQMRQRR